MLGPRLLLRLEGIALGVGAIALYVEAGRGWLLFLLLILSPDLAFVGYALGPRLGAAAYNLTHNTVLPIALGTIAVIADEKLAWSIALIWLAHIGIDRALGYGLKYPTAFKDTHLQRL